MGAMKQQAGEREKEPRVWQTPHGELVAYVRERYRGLGGQPRLCLVGAMGRVFHYDEAGVTSVADEPLQADVPHLRDGARADHGFYRMSDDDFRIGLAAGDLVECEAYWLDPRAKLTVLRRVGDDTFEPSSVNVYRSEVKRVEPQWRCSRCRTVGPLEVPVQCPTCWSILL